jgi:hypothetical protein
MRGYVERMEFLQQFSDDPITADDVLDSYLEQADAAKTESKYK